MVPRILALTGPLPSLPAPLDAAGRLWAGASGRARALVRAAIVGVLVVAAGGGLVRGPWGTPVTVVVTTRPIVAGQPVSADDVTVASRPADLVPDDAVGDLAALADDALAAGPIPAGTIVSSQLLHDGGPAALAVAGTAVVAVPAELLPMLPVGSRVDVAVPTFDGTARIAARAAEVVADDGTWQWLRVDRDDVAAVAAGVSEGRIVAAALPP